MRGGPANRLRDRGAVLINALVIMALLSTVAITLQLRTQSDIARAQVQADAVQGRLYLDSAIALASLALRLDARLTSTDHPGEDWARPDIVVPIDRGVIAVQLFDLQGRFNLNTLADPDDPDGHRAAFLRYASPLGISERSARDIIALAEEAHPLKAIEELAAIGSLTSAQRHALKDQIAMLPGAPPINLNTASIEMLGSLIPQVKPEAWELFDAQRQTPLEDIAAFEALLGDALTQQELDRIDLRAFSTRSDYFAVEATVTLGTRSWSRQSWLQRSGQEAVRRLYQARVY